MFEIIAITLISAVLIIYLRSINQELALLATICVSILLIFMLFGYLKDTFALINKLVEMTNINKDLYRVVIKITLIGYIVEFSAGIVEDFGLKSLSNKLVLAGKLIILSLSMPIIYALLNVIVGLLQ